MSSLVNSNDNSENIAIVQTADRLPASETGKIDEIDLQTKYYKYLNERSKIENSEEKIMVSGKLTRIQELVPARSEFEEERLRIIVLLNNLGVNHSVVRSLMDSFGTNSIFELASEYANYSLSRTRSERLYAILHGDDDTGKIYDHLTAKKDSKGDDGKIFKVPDYDTVNTAEKALNSGNFKAGFGGRGRQYRE